MHRDLCTKVGLYILLGSSMFCLGVLVGFDLKCLKPREKLSPGNPIRPNRMPVESVPAAPVSMTPVSVTLSLEESIQ